MPLVRAGRRSAVRRYGLWVVVALIGLTLLYGVAAALVLHRTASQYLTDGSVAKMQTAADAPERLSSRGDPQAAFGLPFETLAVQTELGPAEAWLVPEPFRPAAPEPHMAAIYVHGMGGAREDGYRYLPLLQAEGLPLLLISYRNDANAPATEDEFYGFSLTEWRDLEAAVLALGDRGYGEVMVIADGMGGAILGQFMARSTQAARVSAIALDSPALEFRTVLAHLAEDLGLPLPGMVARITQGMLWVTQPVNLFEASVTDVFAAFDGPMFVAHGQQDRAVPVSTSRTLTDLRAAAEAVTVAHLTEADYLQSYTDDPAAFEAAFGAFLGLTRRP